MPVIIDRKAAFIDKTMPVTESGCWLWMGSLDTDGYPRLQKKTWGEGLAHRWSYKNFQGALPLGAEIDHLCRIRCCVNPMHLDAVTHQINVARGISRCAKQTTCSRGHIFSTYKKSNGKKRRRCLLCERRGGRKMS